MPNNAPMFNETRYKNMTDITIKKQSGDVTLHSVHWSYIGTELECQYQEFLHANGYNETQYPRNEWKEDFIDE